MQSFAARMSMNAMALVITLVSLTLACAAGPSVAADNVVLIVVDGLRPDALKLAKVPTIDGFIKRGSFTMKAQTVMPSLTLPAVASMLTGLPVDQHGITWNEYEPMRGFLKAPTAFEIASFAAGRLGAMFFGKEKLLHVAKPDRGLFPIEDIGRGAAEYLRSFVFVRGQDIDFGKQGVGERTVVSNGCGV